MSPGPALVNAIARVRMAGVGSAKGQKPHLTIKQVVPEAAETGPGFACKGGCASLYCGPGLRQNDENLPSSPRAPTPDEADPFNRSV